MEKCSGRQWREDTLRMIVQQQQRTVNSGSLMRTSTGYRKAFAISSGLVFLLAVSGCNPRYTKEEMAEQRAAYFASLRAQCGQYGFTPGTPAFASCVQAADQENERASREIQAQNERAVFGTLD